ncbi:MAG: hypothetical protein U1B78_07170 [Dehalococcoidia bacterium]|nr:hypothetical protein [Dehalococcoidia bacterium]
MLALRSAPARALALALIALAVIALGQPGSMALALPPAGTDVLPVDAEVSVTSRLGSETFHVNGTVTVQRGAPYLDGGAEVVDAEITAINMTGTSLTGPVTVTESSTLVSPGELRSLQPPPQQFPASSFFDVFVVIQAPSSPNPTITLRNNVPLHLVPLKEGNAVPIDSWPPFGKTYQTHPALCIPLLPTQPMNACITDLIVGFGPNPVGGIAELPPDDGAAAEHDRDPSAATAFPIEAAIAVGAAALIVLVGSALGYALRRWHR